MIPALLALSFNADALLVAFDFAERVPLASGDAISNSVFGVTVCAVATLLVLRRFRQYPGTQIAQSILPVLAAFYAVFLGLVVLLRLEYSNAILLLCFVGTLLARYAIETLWRDKGMLYCVVPGGKVDRIRRLTRVPILDLHEPRLEVLPRGPIIADLHADLEPEWERLIAEAAISGRPVYHYRQVWETETGRVQINHLSENSFGALVPSFVYQKLKRSVDLLASILVLPVVLPLMAITAILIKLDSKGPVFFLQRRMGFRGKVFNVVKFRTMTEANDGEDREKSVTLTDDERITKIGRFLRKTRLDELPQIVNIVLGQMSWIGPRPEAVSLSTWYEAEIPFYRYRHIVRPGITGWAQVNQGHVASLDEVDDKLQYDFYYIKHLSYWLDIVIALRTLRVVLSGFGAK
ncbi:sugar transferase [Erythrobacter vulgaris]|uniref:Sugar transferase n=1 Tax=Qipengyuania vulgaris TaxID=291985 RepID=A0A844XR50_9SPHN|nr:sugar transferase [Qipengyuania vulgaris]MXO47502.1 sugar transferase [Qipengyuania vulgaris]